MTWAKFYNSTLPKLLLAASILGCMVLFPLLLGRGPGIALALAASILGWIGYLLFKMARVLTKNSPSSQNSFEEGFFEEGISEGNLSLRETRQAYHTIKKALKELELDYEMGKLSSQDYEELRNQYRSRALTLLAQLDKAALPIEQTPSRPKEIAQTESPPLPRHGGMSAMVMLAFLSLTTLLSPGLAGAQPLPPSGGFSPAQMSGIPRLDPSLPKQTIVVRLIQEDFQHNLAQTEVKLVSVDTHTTRVQRTDAEGRSTFTNVGEGTYKAQARYQDQELTSQPIQVTKTSTEGFRVLFVFSAENKAVPPLPNRASSLQKTASSTQEAMNHLYIDQNSYLWIEFYSDDWLMVREFIVLQNPLPTAVVPGEQGLEIALPEGAHLPQILMAEKTAALTIEQRDPNQPPSLFIFSPIPKGTHQIELGFFLQGKETFVFRQHLSLPWQLPTLILEHYPGIKFDSAFFPNRKFNKLHDISFMVASASSDFPKGGDLTFSLRLEKTPWISIIGAAASILLVLGGIFLFYLKKARSSSSLGAETSFTREDTP